VSVTLRELSEEEFLACAAAPMRDVSAEAKNVVDIWPYVDLLDPQSLGVSEIGDVAYVYRDVKGRFGHVLAATDRHNVFVAVIVDLVGSAVLGHRLLDMNREYGITP
jgi:hypothetical protein